MFLMKPKAKNNQTCKKTHKKTRKKTLKRPNLLKRFFQRGLIGIGMPGDVVLKNNMRMGRLKAK